MLLLVMHVQFPSFPFVLGQNCLLKPRKGEGSIFLDYICCISMCEWVLCVRALTLRCFSAAGEWVGG